LLLRSVVGVFVFCYTSSRMANLSAVQFRQRLFFSFYKVLSPSIQHPSSGTLKSSRVLLHGVNRLLVDLLETTADRHRAIRCFSVLPPYQDLNVSSRPADSAICTLSARASARGGVS
jgi:hypothetical protein